MRYIQKYLRQKRQWTDKSVEKIFQNLQITTKDHILFICGL